MKLDEKLISRVANLARLELTDEEKQEFTKQLSDIIEYVEKINEMPTGDVIPADHIVDLKNVFREDRTSASLERSEIEKIAPKFEMGHIVVPRIIESIE